MRNQDKRLVCPVGFELSTDLIKNFPEFVSPHNSIKDLKKSGDRVGTEAKKAKRAHKLNRCKPFIIMVPRDRIGSNHHPALLTYRNNNIF